MKTRDRVATALAPYEAEAIIEQARRRQRRRRQMIGLELVAVIVVWLVGHVRGQRRESGIPLRLRAGRGPRGPTPQPCHRSRGQARVTWRASLGGVLQAYGGGGITFSGKNWSEDLATTVPAEGGLQSGDAVTNRIVDGQGYFTANVHGRWVWVHDPHPDLPGLIFTELPDPRTLLRRLAPAARFRATGDRMRGGVRLSVLRATDPGRVRSFRFLPGVHSGGPVVSLEVWADRHQVVHRMAITFRGTERVDNRQAGQQGRDAGTAAGGERMEKAVSSIPADGEAGPGQRVERRTEPRPGGPAERCPDTPGNPPSPRSR